MSQNLKQFLESLRTDDTTKEALNKASNETTFAEIVVQTGAKKGYSFSIQDVKNAISEAIGGSRELSDSELEAVAGAGEEGGNCPLGSLGGGSNICQ